jgi:nicotinamidase-related amidase
MLDQRTILNTLISVDDCILVVIDVQDSFLRKYAQDRVEKILSRVGWLMEISKILEIPIVATAESIDRMGTLSPSLAERLPPDTPIFNKVIFNLTDNPEIFKAVEKTGRKTAVLVGIETDVCIAQSAIGLLQQGYHVVAVADATASPGDAHAAGLERMRNAGVLVTNVKGLYYEWVRSVERTASIAKAHLQRIGLPIDVIF